MSLYKASVPTYIQLLGSMVTVLDKGIAHAAAKKIEQSVYVNTRLFPDMRPFSFQVHSLADHASGSCQRLAGIEAQLPPRDETTLDQLKTRVAKALDIVKSVTPAAVDARADQDVVFPMGPRKMTMKGSDYMLHFALPNFYFHHTTAYNVLRHCGVEIGKMDFLGVIPGFPKL
jgi:uncharacterized protein